MRAFAFPSVSSSPAWAFLLACSCSAEGMAPDTLEPSAEAAAALVNGTLVSGHTPVVAVYHNKPRPCSGVYLGNRWVMTARHCTDDGQMYVTSELSPGAALPAYRPPPKWRGVAATRVYGGSVPMPSGGEYGPDIALLKLDGDLEAHQGGEIVRVAGRVASTSAMQGQQVFCLGYGRAYNLDAPDSEEATTGSGTQRYGWFSVQVNSEDGSNSLRIMDNLAGQSFSHGDSGGACFVVVSYRGGGAIVLAGISEAKATTWNYMRQYSVARDTPYSNWIDETLAQ